MVMHGLKEITKKISLLLMVNTKKNEGAEVLEVCGLLISQIRFLYYSCVVYILYPFLLRNFFGTPRSD